MEVSKELQVIITQSTFEVIDGNFVYTKANSVPTQQRFFLVAQDKDEVTVVTDEKYLGDVELIEKNKDTYALVALYVSVPFYSVGFLAAISDALAKKGINVLIVSTYSKDYVMVRKALLNKAIEALEVVGLKRKRS